MCSVHVQRQLCALVLLFAAAQAAASDPIKQSAEELQAARVEAEAAERPALLERHALERGGRLGQSRLAPDGRHLVYSQQQDDASELWLLRLDAGDKKEPVRRRLLSEARGLSFDWSGDGARLWLADPLGLAVFESQSGQLRRLYKWQSERHPRYWGVDPRAHGYALLQEKVPDKDGWQYRYLRIDAAANTELIWSGDQSLRGVLLDAAGELRFSAGYEGVDYDTVVRRHQPERSEELLRCRGSERCMLSASTADFSVLWVVSQQGDDRSSLRRWQAGRWTLEHQDPAGIADVAAALHAADGEWRALAYHPARRIWHARDPEMAHRLQRWQRQIGRANLSIEASADGRTWLLRAARADWPQDKLFLYRQGEPQLQPLLPELAAAVDLQAKALVDAIPLHYPASDGRLLHGYVYLPRGLPLGQAGLIAMIHGGPFNRDRDRFDPYVQLLVNRGHIVFQPNFRGSTGYGQRYLHSAEGEFGNGRVLADIIEGMDYLLAQGIGDAGKQAVMGHSFGGYASLLAVSHHPQRFRFAYASAAPVDMGWVMTGIGREDSGGLPEDGPPAEIHLRHYGLHDSAEHAERLRQDAPLKHLDKLQADVLLWAGARDDRVPLNSIVRYAAGLKQAGKPVSLLIDPEAGHGPDNKLSAEALIYLAERAAQQHLGGRLQAPSPELSQFLNRHSKL
ncbi:S9 family peptidase [Pseudomarimonas arenosa]|uniref:S9 family peptidase n=1 Tax=Pseudomarimonas arenosa TaxID=2774145 RepID=A0AAW3ZI83_9GAMM|nr:prolyl oligopeptidase family serine peptidase [Pseudomarimonas arenosa]MBD8525229.1 S9 family peptidase [Pseudomarimonas arenosa]